MFCGDRTPLGALETNFRHQTPSPLPNWRLQLPGALGRRVLQPSNAENNPGWRTKWFYAKDQPSAGQGFMLDEFCPTNILWPWASWAHELTEEEMKITQPLMEMIQQLRATPEKELSGLQLIRTFIERRIQPLAARAHCMWDYTGHRDPTRFSSNELREAEIDDRVRVVTSLKKKSTMPKIFGTEAFSKSHPCTEVCIMCLLTVFFRPLIDFLSRVKG
jgi:hypothetical protein